MLPYLGWEGNALFSRQAVGLTRLSFGVSRHAGQQWPSLPCRGELRVTAGFWERPSAFVTISPGQWGACHRLQLCNGILRLSS